eukprot:GEMP01033013.1.p1 GENE.GEMP01033013.1~~GEMP01033013.1.p1  ORF type:complete len:454 (+),score=108.35 GEMP01033013.1:326-1687(+)
MDTARLLRSRREKIVEMETRDTGHPVSEVGPGHVDIAIDTLEFYSSLCHTAHDGSYIPLANGNYAHTVREPYGVISAIVAWNYPFQMALYKVAIALAGGNAVVMKPSSKTPINTVGLAKIFHEAGLPKGVFNVVQGGAQVGSDLVQHPDVDKVSFTGSTGVGAKILAMCAPNIRPATVELGGKSPLIVFPDADLESAVQAAMIANFYSAGEICTNGTRVFVHERVYDEFLSMFIEAASKLRVGDPMDPSTHIGSLIDVPHANSVREFITKGMSEGAACVCGDTHVEDKLPSHLDPEAYVPPTIFSNVKDDMALAREEIFGPVASVLKFSDEQEVISRANATPFGLASGVFTKDLSCAARVSQRLKAGVVWVNNYNVYHPAMPVGGYKASGFGREFGREAIDHVTQLKSVYHELGRVPQWEYESLSDSVADHDNSVSHQGKLFLALRSIGGISR